MRKAEKHALVVCALLLALTLAYFAVPAPQAVFTQTQLPPAATAAPDERLDINHATADELDELPGIGETLAARIVAYREEHGVFSSPEELLAVEGIGEGRLAAIEDYIRCGEEMP